MNKKLILLGSLALVAGSGLQACHLKISNNTDKAVVLQSHLAREDKLKLMPGRMNVPFGEQEGDQNHGEMADFTLTIVGSDAKPIRVVQTLCSTDYETHLEVSEIINKQFSDKNSKLFTFDEKAKAGTCGCKAGEQK